MPAVEVSHLVKRYAATTAVADASFTAAAGAVTAVLGPNGAGKSTTVEICCGLRRADGGEVKVLGRDPARDTAELRTRVGVMPQAGGSSASGVYPAARVRETLVQHGAFHAHPLAVDPLLDRLGLTDRAATPWRRLSGGEQQRLSLGLAVVGRPEVVFLDEPTAGLDVAARHATWDLVRDLRDCGVALVLTTHAMEEAEQLADTVVILDRGRVVAAGTPGELTAGAGDESTGLTFTAVPGLPVSELDVVLPPGCRAVERSPGEYAVTGPVTPDVVAAVTAWCAGRGVLPDRLSTGGRSLEDVFLELTTRTAE